MTVVDRPGTAGPAGARRREPGAATARSLVRTVLGEFALPGRDPVWTATLLMLLADLGVAEKAARQAVMRTADDGWICAQRVGRETRWVLTDRGAALLAEDTRCSTDAAAQRAWDGRWLVLTVVVPEDRARRRRLRTRLTAAGLGPAGPGVWVTPRVDREAQAAGVLADLGLARSSWSFLARTGTLGDERSLVRTAWDLDAQEARYGEFLDRVGSRRPRTDRQALTAQVELVQQWRPLARRDPGLPRELLPPRWSGHRAAQVFRERHATWAPRAAAAWAALSRSV